LQAHSQKWLCHVRWLAGLKPGGYIRDSTRAFAHIAALG
jgi:hypothetical protein